MRARVGLVRTRPETVVADLVRLLGAVVPGRGATRGTWVDLEEGTADDAPGRIAPPWSLEAALEWVAATAGPLDDLLVRTSGRVPRPLARVLERRAVATETEVAGRWSASRQGRFACVVAPLRRLDDGGVGGVCATLELLASDPADLAAALAAHREMHPRAVFVVDATVCGDLLGRGVPAVLHYVVASTDPVAADAAALRLVGVDPAREDRLVAAAGSGLGRFRASEVDWVAEEHPGCVAATRVEGARGLLRRGNPFARRAGVRFDRTPWGRMATDYAEGRVTAGTRR